MTEDIAFQLLSIPFETIHLVFIFGILRIFGLSYSFYAFGWGMGSALTLRISIALVLSIPVMVANFPDIVSISETAGPLNLVLLAAKEFAIGFGFGLLASSPFRALQYAGSILDSFRGETDSGLTAPDQTALQTTSLLYLIIGFFVFFSSGGLWKLIETLYASYEIWPMNRALPGLYEGGANIALTALNSALGLGLVIIAPLMILLLSVEIVLMVAAKLGKRFGLYDLTFLMKNIITIITLPIMTAIILRISDAQLPRVFDIIPQMEAFFR